MDEVVTMYELQRLCEMAKICIDALGDDIEENSTHRRDEDQTYLSIFVIWEKIERISRLSAIAASSGNNQSGGAT